MTNLTSEQYRDVLKHVQNCTEKIPTVQDLLRVAVTTFYNRFGCYPEMAGVAPGKVCMFGEQTQFDGGLALPAAMPLATIVVGRRARGTRFTVVTTADVGKPHKVKFSFSRKRPLAPGSPSWLNYVKGIIDNYKADVPPFDAAITSSLPMGVSFGSTSALETSVYTFLEVLVGKAADPLEKAEACQKAERDFASKDVGLVDRITSILAKDRHAMLIDCMTNEVEWIPFRHSEITFIAVDSHEKDVIFREEYKETSKYLSKACRMLNVTSLRDCTQDDILELEQRVQKEISGFDADVGVNGKDADIKAKTTEPRATEAEETWSEEEYNIMLNRVKFYVSEMRRVKEALNAWESGDIETFGDKMKESHRALVEYFEIENPLLNFLVDASLQVEGVLGSKMTGMGLGFGGGIISMVKKENIESYCHYVTEKFASSLPEIWEELKDQRKRHAENKYEIRKKAHSNHYNPTIASSEKIGRIQNYLEQGGALTKVGSKRVVPFAEKEPEKKKTPCIVKVEKPAGGCGTWGRYQKDKEKEEFFRKKSIEEEKENEEKREEPEISAPNFYIVSPFAGARKMFVTKTDLLRSLLSQPVPHPKSLVKSALGEYDSAFDCSKAEAIGIAPATLTLFGEFMEFHLGYIICMALPLVTVTVGGRSDSVYFSVKTTSNEVEEPKVMKNPLPCVRALEMESRTWVNFVLGCVNEFKGHVPGFNAVISSSVPIQAGLNSCSALQASIYTFLEGLTGSCTTDSFEKADRCAKSEYEFQSAPSELVTRCSTIKFFPTFLCKEGHLMFVNCKRYKISQYFFDHPSFVFLIACCKNNTNTVTIETLDERLKLCIDALEILGRNSLLTADLKHLHCLEKRDASEEIIKRVKYVITEHQRTIEAVKAIKEEDYKRVGFLMNQSHISLRDDYEVSSPEIETLVSLASRVDGVLGVKMLGRGLNATVVILLRISEADNCMRYMRKHYKPKTDRPIFYVTKPSEGAFMMNPIVEMPLVP